MNVGTKLWTVCKGLISSETNKQRCFWNKKEQRVLKETRDLGIHVQLIRRTQFGLH